MADTETTSHQEEEALGKAYDSRLARRLLTYLRPYKWKAALAVVLLITNAGVELVGPLLTQRAIDVHIPASDWDGLHLVAGAYVLALMLAFVLDATQTYVTQIIGQLVQYDLRREIFAHLQRIDVSF